MHQGLATLSIDRGGVGLIASTCTPFGLSTYFMHAYVRLPSVHVLAFAPAPLCCNPSYDSIRHHTLIMFRGSAARTRGSVDVLIGVLEIHKEAEWSTRSSFYPYSAVVDLKRQQTLVWTGSSRAVTGTAANNRVEMGTALIQNGTHRRKGSREQSRTVAIERSIPNFAGRTQRKVFTS